ncbi:MAG: hypothetical protein WBQ89_10020, partial [Candidatus Acidiferrum sp.]
AIALLGTIPNTATETIRAKLVLTRQYTDDISPQIRAESFRHAQGWGAEGRINRSLPVFHPLRDDAFCGVVVAGSVLLWARRGGPLGVAGAFRRSHISGCEDRKPTQNGSPRFQSE